MLKIIRSLLNKKRRLKATGLAETVAALGILSMTMVTAIGVTVKSMRLTKQTEIQDRANTIQIRAMEFAKSPAEFAVSGSISSGDVASFSVQLDQNGSIILEREPGTQEIGNNCSESSDYYVNFKAWDPDSVDVVCNQMIIEGITNSDGKLVYEIQATTVYLIFGEFYKTTMLGYRHDEIIDTVPTKNPQSNPYI